MRKKFLGLTALVLLLAGCGKPYVVVVEPQSLKRFGKFTVAEFSTQRYLERLKGSAKQENYEKATIDANNAIQGRVTSIMRAQQGTPGGPELFITAELDEFRTGSGAARGLAAFGLVPRGVGEGVISYFITLKSGGKIIGTAKVSTKIVKAADQAYAATGQHIAMFLTDRMAE